MRYDPGLAIKHKKAMLELLRAHQIEAQAQIALTDRGPAIHISITGSEAERAQQLLPRRVEGFAIVVA